MKIGILTDTHNRVDGYGESRVDSILSYYPTADLVLHLGDVSSPFWFWDEYDIEEWELQGGILTTGPVDNILAKIRTFPQSAALFGNHDTMINLADYKSSVYGQYNYFAGANYTYGSFDLNGLHFVLLDTNYSQDAPHDEYYGLYDLPAGYRLYVPDHELTWLANDLAAAKYPCVICVHGDLSETSSTYFRVLNADAVRSVIESSGKAFVILQGHMHTQTSTTINDVFYYTFDDASSRVFYGIIDVNAEAKDFEIKQYSEAALNNSEVVSFAGIKITEATITNSQMTISSWDGAAIYYQIDGTDEGAYTLYSVPVDVSDAKYVSYYATDGAGYIDGSHTYWMSKIFGLQQLPINIKGQGNITFPFNINL